MNINVSENVRTNGRAWCTRSEARINGIVSPFVNDLCLLRRPVDSVKRFSVYSGDSIDSFTLVVITSIVL